MRKAFRLSRKLIILPLRKHGVYWATKLATPVKIDLNSAIGHSRISVLDHKIDLLLFFVASGPHSRSRIYLS
jgi:hypothetical protein